MKRAVVFVALSILVLITILGIASIGLKTSSSNRIVHYAQTMLAASRGNSDTNKETVSLFENLRYKNEDGTEAVNSAGSISLFGLHGVKVMPSCNESDGFFSPPLVSISRGVFVSSFRLFGGTPSYCNRCSAIVLRSCHGDVVVLFRRFGLIFFCRPVKRILWMAGSCFRPLTR
jgi:hypothetical protein